MDSKLNRRIYYFRTQKSLERFIEQFKDIVRKGWIAVQL